MHRLVAPAYASIRSAPVIKLMSLQFRPVETRSLPLLARRVRPLQAERLSRLMTAIRRLTIDGPTEPSSLCSNANLLLASLRQTPNNTSCLKFDTDAILNSFLLTKNVRRMCLISCESIVSRRECFYVFNFCVSCLALRRDRKLIEN